ncbi:CPBP family intramembrane glutamic endopeptidase [Faecalispora anaeroviscerum]|uniref:CPBP family intramembrane glutamic endopeptidase n=1 Tax=Faecalispora anaeroviscerum TaxID=2991836 RepID=UPI0024BB6B86|nr:CPBP family intramembrane glutamic endopeptidase [Faecalispora anaeroviscerum]
MEKKEPIVGSAIEPCESKKDLEEIASFANRLLLLFLASYGLSSIVVRIVKRSMKRALEDDLSRILLLCVVLILVLVLGSRLFHTTPKRIAFGERTAPKLPAMDSILLTLSLFFFEWGIVFLSLPFMKRFSPDEFNPDPLSYFLMIAIIGFCILVPVNEEILFRRIGFQYAQKHGTMFAVITSSIMFAFAHGVRFQVFYALLLGLCAGILCAKTGSILWPILLHMVHNGFNFVMPHLFPFYEGIPSLRFYSLWVLFAVLCAVCFLLYAARQQISLRNVSIKASMRTFWTQMKSDKSKYKAYFTSAGGLGFILIAIINLLGWLI